MDVVRPQRNDCGRSASRRGALRRERARRGESVDPEDLVGAPSMVARQPGNQVSQTTQRPASGRTSSALIAPARLSVPGSSPRSSCRGGPSGATTIASRPARNRRPPAAPGPTRCPARQNALGEVGTRRASEREYCQGGADGVNNGRPRERSERFTPDQTDTPSAESRCIPRSRGSSASVRKNSVGLASRTRRCLPRRRARRPSARPGSAPPRARVLAVRRSRPAKKAVPRPRPGAPAAGTRQRGSERSARPGGDLAPPCARSEQ